MVDIYLKLNNSDAFVRFLSIPQSDIQRLSIRPLKWLRFVTFTICGSYGHLHETAAVNTPPVDYNISDLVESSTYYYIPERPARPYAFIERITSSELTQHQRSFRNRIMGRDGRSCVFTAEAENVCRAVHIIPKSKGDEYIDRVIQLRSHLYDHVPDISGINDTQNGIFLNALLHKKYSSGAFAFLKTPNFALNSDDIPGVGRDPTLPIPLNLTLQQFVPPMGRFPYPDCLSAIFCGTVGGLFPPSILLDYMYGVTAYKCWKVSDIHSVVNQYFSQNY
ncbi:hypothetical protein JOM56_010886 [Amanita muscaria]